MFLKFCLLVYAGGEDISDQDGNTITMTVAVTPPPPQ